MSTAEADDDKHLDAQHVIEEAMSKHSPFKTCRILMYPYSPSTHAQLSKVSKMYGVRSFLNVSL